MKKCSGLNNATPELITAVERGQIKVSNAAWHIDYTAFPRKHVRLRTGGIYAAGNPLISKKSPGT
jgi:hypothetical protein